MKVGHINISFSTEYGSLAAEIHISYSKLLWLGFFIYHLDHNETMLSISYIGYEPKNGIYCQDEEISFSMKMNITIISSFIGELYFRKYVNSDDQGSLSTANLWTITSARGKFCDNP